MSLRQWKEIQTMPRPGSVVMNLPVAWQTPRTAHHNGIQFAVLVTSLGWHGVSIRDGQLVRLNPPVRSADAVIESMGREPNPQLDESNRVLLRRVEEQLNEYAEGRRLAFDLPLALEGTDFQLAVWRHLMTIPAGETATYQSVACAVGNSRAARAVGGAVAANPIAIMIPCHRVIRSNGALGGYAGGSWVKAVLLELERVHLAGI